MTAESPRVIPDSDKRRYLLQYILQSRGVCHENSLILGLMHLEMDSGTYDSNWTASDWEKRLGDHIADINVKLSGLNYKVVRCGHGIGRSAVMKKNKQYFNVNRTGNEGEFEISLPESNRFYVYVNLAFSEEAKLATQFKPDEILFVKWCLEKFCTQGNVVKACSADRSLGQVQEEVDRMLADLTGDTDVGLKRYVTFTVGSTELSHFDDLSATEIERVLNKLCELKWFYRGERGEFGMDLRTLVELEEYLVGNFSVPRCQNCSRAVVQGVQCGNDGDGEETGRSWHVDCFQHYITHISKDCDRCGMPLLENGIYML